MSILGSLSSWKTERIVFSMIFSLAIGILIGMSILPNYESGFQKLSNSLQCVNDGSGIVCHKTPPCKVSLVNFQLYGETRKGTFSIELDLPEKFSTGYIPLYCKIGNYIPYISSNNYYSIPSEATKCTLSVAYEKEFPSYVCKNLEVMDHWDRSDFFERK